MRQPGWDEPAEPSGQAPAQGPGHTGVVESGEYEQGLLPPTRWRPATAPPRWYPDRPDIVAGLVATAALVALTLAGLAGAVVTWKFGTVLAPAPTESALRDVGRVVYPALRLRATAALVVEPVAAVVTYLLCAGFAAQNDLGRQDTPAGRDPDLN